MQINRIWKIQENFTESIPRKKRKRAQKREPFKDSFYLYCKHHKLNERMEYKGYNHWVLVFLFLYIYVH